MPDFLMPMTEFATQEVKLLFYGDSGTGKTWATSRLPNVLIVDFEKGLRSAPTDGTIFACKVGDLRAAFNLDRREYPSISVTITDVEDLKKVWGLVREHPSRFDTVVLDSITTLGDMSEEWIRTKFAKAGTQRVQADDGSGVLIALTIQGWGYSQNKLNDAIMAFRFLPVNVIFVFHEQEITVKDQPSRFRPKLKGKDLLPRIQGLVDFAIRIELANHKVGPNVTVRRRFRCHPTPTIWAKVRDGEGDLLATHEPADLHAFMEKVTGRTTDEITVETVEEKQPQLTTA
jgi:hypothetical protein